MKLTKLNYENVLLIDDNAVDNFVHEKVISAAGFAKRVYSATSALSALEFIHNMNVMGHNHSYLYPQVIFIDINMPVINGFEFIAFFKEKGHEHLLQPKLVILTSSLSKKDKLLAMEASENIVFLNKPLTPEMLKDI